MSERKSKSISMYDLAKIMDDLSRNQQKDEEFGEFVAEIAYVIAKYYGGLPDGEAQYYAGNWYVNVWDEDDFSTDEEDSIWFEFDPDSHYEPEYEKCSYCEERYDKKNEREAERHRDCIAAAWDYTRITHNGNEEF